MKKKITILTTAAVLVAVLAGVGYAVKGPFGHHGKGFMKERILSKIDYTVQELKLSADQQVKYSAIRDRMSGGMDAMSERHEAAHDTLKAEMDKANPDVKAMAEKMKKEIAFMSGSMTTQIDYMVDIFDILNPEQQKQFTAQLKKHMDRKHKRFGDRFDCDDD